jgi:undecaprenyl-phosphate galactose phosphotransferase/putative colanic acid biosynthesis UDP-glucose lipid carrier transferase
MMTLVSHAIPGAAHRIRRRFRIAFSVIEPLVAGVDAAIIVGASVFGGATYQLVVNHRVGDLTPYIGLGLIGSLAYALAAHLCELYRLHEMPQRQRDYVRVATCWLWAVLVIGVVLFLIKNGAQMSRGSMICFALLGNVGLLSWRAAARRWLRSAIDRGVIQGRRVILIGTDQELANYNPRDLLTHYGLDEVVRFPLPKDAHGDQRSRAPVLTKVLEHSRKGAADEIVLALPWGDEAQLRFVLDRLQLTPMRVRLLPDRSVHTVLQDRRWSTQHLPLVEIQRPPITATERIRKRALDLSIAGLALACLLPLMVLVTAAIRIDSRGPAIFRQRRKGFNGKEFVIYKFRTMTVMEDGESVAQARRSDSRVTRLGSLLRRTSIDELPQLFNVLRGDMSLVGPRPHALAHDQEYSPMIADYAYRHHVKPGITGWAQVNGYRGGTPRVEYMARRIELDLWYINNWTLALDLEILARTCFELIRPRNAY